MKKTYIPFDIANFPAYEFRDGKPYRVVPISRGRLAGWTGALTPFKHSQTGDTCFTLTRKDGKRVVVSERSILLAIEGHVPAKELEPETLGDRKLIPGFADYVASDTGVVWRFRSAKRGNYAKLRALVPVNQDKQHDPAYTMVNNRGEIKRLTPEQVQVLIGTLDPKVLALRKSRQHHESTTRRFYQGRES